MAKKQKRKIDSEGTYELDKSKTTGEYFFHLKADGNGEIVHPSQMYTSKQAAQEGIEACIYYAAHSKVVDLTGE